MDILIYILISISTILGALFRMLDSSQTIDEKNISQTAYGKFWNKIDSLGINKYPSLILNFYTKSLSKSHVKFKDVVLTSSLNRSVQSHNRWAFIWPLTLLVLISPVGYMLITEKLLFPLSIIVFLLMPLWLILVTPLVIVGFDFIYNNYITKIMKYDNISPEILKKAGEKIFLFQYGASYLLLFSAFVALTVNTFALSLDQRNLGFFTDENLLSAMVSNYLIDITVFFITISLVKSLNKKVDLFSKALIFFTIIIIAFACSYLSSIVFVNLEFSSYNYTELFYSLIGRSSDNSRWEIWNLFYISHTSFFLISFFLISYIISIIAKTIVLPISKIGKKTTIVESPHKLTSNMFLFFAAIFTAIKLFLG